MTSAPSWLYNLLEKNSTDKYSIEYDYNGLLLSNHLTHGIISLWWLEADEQRIQHFIDCYTKKLDPAEEDDLSGDLPDLDALRGQWRRFNDLLRHYQRQLRESCDGDLSLLVGQEFPGLAAGLSNVALHGLIHLGYGFSVASERVVCEGLAYLHYSYVPLDDSRGPDLSTLGKGSQDIVDVLLEVESNSVLREAVLKDIQDPSKSRNRTRFQNLTGAMMDHHSEELLNYVHAIKFPTFWDPSYVTPEQVKLITEWIFDCIVTVYLKSRQKNDFFLLHGVTAAWSLCQILPSVSQEKEVLRIVRVFVATLVSVYVARGCPLLDSDQDVRSDFPQIIKEALSEDRDEHIYKLVQVCHDRSKKNESLKELYLKASTVALSHPL